MKKAIICLGLGLASVESNADFLNSCFAGNTPSTVNNNINKSGESYAASTANNVSESFAVNGGVKANNINNYENSGSKAGNRVASSSSTTSYNKVNTDQVFGNKVATGTTGCDDLSFSNDYGTNDNCSDNQFNVNIPQDSSCGSSAIDEGCGSGKTYGVSSTDFGNFSNYGANNENGCGEEDNFGKSSTVASSNTNNLGNYVFGGKTNDSCADNTVNTPRVVINRPTVQATPQVVINRPTVQAAPQVVINRPTVQAAPQVIVNRPTVQNTPVIVQNNDNTQAVEQVQNNYDQSGNANLSTLNKQAANSQQNANTAAYKNTVQNAKLSKSAQQKYAAALNAAKNIITSDDKICSNAKVVGNKKGCSSHNLDKDALCHANDESLHKEEHCAEEQNFQNDDCGKVKTLECTHIVECVTKDCEKGESAKRQIWSKKKSCAKKRNDKRASAKNLHKATHKNVCKNAFKQSLHKANVNANHDCNHDACNEDSKLSTNASAALRNAASSDEAAASCYDASSNNNINQGSSANSNNVAASSNDQGLAYGNKNAVKQTGKVYSSKPVETC